MTAVFLAMASASLLILLVGDGESQRLGGAIGLLMFAGGGLAWFAGEYATRAAGPPRNGLVRLPDGTASPALIIPSRRGKARAAIVGQAVVAIASVLVVFNPNIFGRGSAYVPWLFAGIAILLGTSVLSSIRGWVDNELMVALTPAGLLARGLGSASFVPWDAVTRIERTHLRGLPFLGIDVKDSRAIRRTGQARLLGRLERSITRHDLSIDLVGHSVPPDEMARLIEHYHQHPGDPALLGVGAGEVLRAGLG